jgi:hypothetical protein
MTTSTHSPPTVVKWPFFAGDGLCIATMATILALADRPLSGGVTAAAVGCLLVGVVLALLPYLIDYEARLRIAEALAHASIENQIRKAAGFAEQLHHSVSRSQSTAEEIEKVLASNEESMEKLVEQVEYIGQWMNGDDKSTNRTDVGLADTLKSVEAGISQLAQATTDLAGRETLTPENFKAGLAEMNRRLEITFERLNAASANTRSAPVPTDKTKQPNEEARETGNTGPSNPEPTAQALPADKEKSAEDSIVERTEDEEESRLNESEQAEGDPQFTFNEKSTSLIATAYIGIGNKLFLRGDGPGLSWEVGVPMQFLSIGKWGWSALEVDEPITCRIYKNDDEPAIDGDIILDPAELKEISPRF